MTLFADRSASLFNPSQSHVERHLLRSTLPVAIQDPGLAAALSDGMERVEERLLAAIETDNDLLSSTSSHLILAGGRRLRPFFALLGAQFERVLNDDVVEAGVVVELTHLGTLYHDDVMDGAQIRRGVLSAHAQWGVKAAVRTGDFLFARASNLVSRLGAEATQLHAWTFNQLVAGQSSEIFGPPSSAEVLDHHLKVLDGKTASLFAFSGKLGSIMAGASKTVSRQVEKACQAWGLAYQLADDLLDVTGDMSESGKASGADLRTGVPTLPTIFALRSDDPSDDRLIELLRLGPLTNDDLHAEALELLRAHPAVDVARSEVWKWADVAEREISALPDGPARRVFAAMCDLIREQVTPELALDDQHRTAR